jgi:hypothetical protein
MRKICFALFLSAACLLYGQQDAATLSREAERDIAAGNFIAGQQKAAEALSIAQNNVVEPADYRRIVLSAAKADMLVARFDEAERLVTVTLKDNIPDLSPEQEVGRQIILAECAIAKDDLKAADEAAGTAMDRAPRNLSVDLKANLAAELAEIRRLQGKFTEASGFADTVMQNSKDRLSSADLSPRALIVPAEVDFSIGKPANARSLAEAVLAAHPADHPVSLMARELLVRIAVAEGRIADASTMIPGLADAARRRLGGTHPFPANCVLTEALYLGQRGAWAEARDKLASIPAAAGSRSRALRFRQLLYRANVAVGLDRPDEAAGYASEATSLTTHDPDVAALLNVQAAIAIEQRRFENAEQYLRDASRRIPMADELQPLRLSIRFNEGVLYDRREDSARADERLQRWITLRPDAMDEQQAQALNVLARNARRAQRYGQEALFLSQAIDVRTSLNRSQGRELPKAYAELGEAYRHANQLDSAVQAYNRALDLGRRQGSPPDPSLYEPLSESLLKLNKIPEALPYFDARLRQMDSATEDYLRLADRVAQLHYAAGQYADAESLLREIYSAGQLGRGPGARDKSGILERLGETEGRLGHFSRSASFYEELARIDMLTDATRFPEAKKDAEKFAVRARDAAQNVRGTADLAAALNVLADVMLAEGKIDEAKSLYLQASADEGASSQTRAASLNGEAGIELKRKEWSTADKLLGEALGSVRQSKVPSPGLEALIAANRAMAQDQLGNREQADALYAHFLELEPQSHPPDDPPLLEPLKELVRFYSPQNGRERQVMDAEDREVNLSRKVFGEQSGEYGWALNSLADEYKQNKRYDEAISRYKDSSRIFEQSMGVQSEQFLMVRSSEADAYQAEGKSREAIQTIEPMMPASPNLSSPVHVALFEQLAGLYTKTEDPAKAIPIYRTLIDASAKQAPAFQNMTWLGNTQNLIAAMIAKGDSKGAEMLLKTTRDSVRRSAGNKDSPSEVRLLQAYAAALKKSGRPADKKLADKTEETITQMQKRLGS